MGLLNVQGSPLCLCLFKFSNFVRVVDKLFVNKSCTLYQTCLRYSKACVSVPSSVSTFIALFTLVGLFQIQHVSSYCS